MQKILEGVTHFQREIYPQERALFESLATGQSPKTMMITCADSRIELGRLTQSKPGELFVCRNAGNIVPAYGEINGGVTATIEYAIMALKIPHIIVCGHSDCGAMKGVMYPEKVQSLKTVAQWLAHGDKARAVVKALGPYANEAEELRMLSEYNVAAQIDNLKTHPAVAAAMAKGELTLHGWFFDIGKGEVEVLDQASNRFVAFAAAYRDMLSGSLAGTAA
jgi:carbonic anhydrase